MATGTQNIGRITQVIGSTFDAEFDEDKLPAIYSAVTVNAGMRMRAWYDILDISSERGHDETGITESVGQVATIIEREQLTHLSFFRAKRHPGT